MSDITPTPYSWRDPKTIPTRAEEIRDLNSRIEAQAAEIETLKTMIFATGEAAAANLRTAMERALEIERLREALTQIARLRTDLSGDFSLGSHQSDIARAALEETLHVPETCKENGETFT